MPLFCPAYELNGTITRPSVLLGNDHKPPGAAGNRVRQSAREVIMIASAVLILNYEFRAIGTLRDDVYTSPTRCLDLRLAKGGKVHPDRRPDLIQLLGEQRREVCCLAPPRIGEPAVLKSRHRRHALGISAAMGRALPLSGWFPKMAVVRRASSAQPTVIQCGPISAYGSRG
jgi:hypothetical protein